MAVELRRNAESLIDFVHPEHALYVFGPEDGSLGRATLAQCHRFLVIPTRHCANLSAAVYTVLYDRHAKRVHDGLELPHSTAGTPATTGQSRSWPGRATFPGRRSLRGSPLASGSRQPPISCTYAWTPPPACSAAPPFRSRLSRRTWAIRRRRHSAARSRTATARHRPAGDETRERNTRERPTCRDVAPFSRRDAGEEPAAELLGGRDSLARARHRHRSRPCPHRLARAAIRPDRHRSHSPRH